MGTKDSAWGPLSGFESETGEDPPIRLVGPLHLRAATVKCWHCGGCTAVHALIASDVVDMGQPGRAPCYVYGIHHPPQALLDAIAPRTPHFRLAASRTGARLLANHCELCGALQPDYRLHAEPSCPFWGEPPPGEFGPAVLESDVGLEFAEYSY
jgi:hypothetical protein